MSFRYYKITPLIIAILLLSTVLDFGIYKLIIPFLKKHDIEFLRAPGNAALIASILMLYDKLLWRIPIFKLLVSVPDMRGRYKGKLNYTFQEKEGETDCYIEISQTSSKIRLNSYFQTEGKPDTNSKSLVESIVEEDGFYYIYLYYLNYGSKENADLDCHEGANMLKFLPATEQSKKRLIGHYFTNRKEQTRGKMSAEFESKTLEGTF